MRKSILISIIGILFLSSCGNENDKADAYGNFEATEIIISSETPGKIIKFPINEGQKLTDNQFICLIDTSDIFLKKKSLTAQKNALASKYSDILAQVKVFEEQKKVIEIRNESNN